MTRRRMLTASIATAMLFGLSGCATPNRQLMTMDTSQVRLRNIQTRAFDSTDKIKVLRSVISTLQDFDFMVGDANKALGMVSAARVSDGLQVSVTVRRRNETQLLVRANMEYNTKGVENPSVYQKFFTVLEKSMFLTAHEVD